MCFTGFTVKSDNGGARVYEAASRQHCWSMSTPCMVWGRSACTGIYTATSRMMLADRGTNIWTRKKKCCPMLQAHLTR